MRNEAGFDEGDGPVVYACFTLFGREVNLVSRAILIQELKGKQLTCPPENPTATTPRSWGFDKNLDFTIDVHMSTCIKAAVYKWDEKELGQGGSLGIWAKIQGKREKEEERKYI